MRQYVKVFGVLTAIAIVSLAVVGLVHKMTTAKAGDNAAPRYDTILVQFDRFDFERMNGFMKRFADGRDGYLMLIPPIVDGGYSIHDVRSDGGTIDWTIDRSRDDGMRGGDPDSKQTLRCRSLERTEDAERYWFVLSKCDGYEEHAELPIVSFEKERVRKRIKEGGGRE
ncbi:hypothetical protein [Paenibacillus flagellatus]|nr:hypothetical protein [Paenibacillus flagellatus]